MAVYLNYWMLSGVNRLLVGLFLLLFGAPTGIQGWIWAEDARVFVENLRGTDGKVTRITRFDGDLKIDVEYLDEIGIRYHKEFVVDDKQERQLRQLERVSVVYDLRTPGIAEIGHVVSANNTRLSYVGIALAGMFLCLIGGWLIGRQFFAIMSTLALFKNGQITQTEVRDSALAPGKTAGRFTYAFRGPDGRWYEGKSPEMPAKALAAWPVGKRITVAFDAANPRRTEVDVFGVVATSRPDVIQPT